MLADIASTLVKDVAAVATKATEPNTPPTYQPILFVHGNGDSSALWIAVIWRFESNNYPANLLFTIDFPNPMARNEDDEEQPARSGTAEQKQQLSDRVDEVLRQTGAAKLILVANSRGGNSVRNYLKNGNGVAKVSKAILCGVPNHGVRDIPVYTSNEFNGAGPFLKGLNRPSELVEGVVFMTIRSDKNDKFAQPFNMQHLLGVGYAAPELHGANNVVLPNVDHRETAYSPQAFGEIYKFITGNSPTTTSITPQATPQISGMVTGFEHGSPTNKGVEGAHLTIYQIDQQSGARATLPVHQTVTDSAGNWVGFVGSSTGYYEFVLEVANQPVRHFFRSPFLRTTRYINLRLDDEKTTLDKALVIYTRPRGYVATGRDHHLFDGKPLPKVKTGVPTESLFRLELTGPERPIEVVLNAERMMIRAIPDHIVHAEFTY